MKRAFALGTMVRLPQELQVQRNRSIPSRLPHLHSQLPMEYSTNSRELVSRKSWMGNSDLKTACSPMSSRSEGATYICRKRSYECFCTSIRFGIGTEVLILEKSIRSRGPWTIASAISRLLRGFWMEVD